MNEITCQVCGAVVKDYVLDHVLEAHDMGEASYLAAYPTATIMSTRLKVRYDSLSKPKRQAPPPPDRLSIAFAGTEMPINADVPEEVCLPLPDHYSTPRKGDLGTDVQHVAIALKYGRSTYVHGLPGSGKDAIFHAWSNLTRTPAIIRQVKPGTDIESWFFYRGFDQHGTVWEEGEVLKALRDGYTTPTGRVVPYLLLISDMDRATRDQAEHLRLITDSIQGRVDGPAGKVYRVLPGTRIVATANTAGGGDERGRMVSANPLDASILDRFERKIQFHWMCWDDEGPIIRNKFPDLFIRFPELERKLKDTTSAIRTAVLNDELHGEFSHRSLCAILSHMSDILKESKKSNHKNILTFASRVWVDGLPDSETRAEAIRLLDPHFRSLEEGDHSNIKKGSLR